MKEHLLETLAILLAIVIGGLILLAITADVPAMDDEKRRSDRNVVRIIVTMLLLIATMAVTILTLTSH